MVGRPCFVDEEIDENSLSMELTIMGSEVVGNSNWQGYTNKNDCGNYDKPLRAMIKYDDYEHR